MLTVLQQLTNLVYSTDLTQSVRICIELISIITGSICFTNVSSMTTSKDVFFMTASIFLSTICFNLLFYFSCNNILVCYDLQQLWQSSANSCGISDKWLWQKYGSKYSQNRQYIFITTYCSSTSALVYIATYHVSKVCGLESTISYFCFSMNNIARENWK